jgi:uncharacterized protein YjiS (DUF1127 family)
MGHSIVRAPGSDPVFEAGMKDAGAGGPGPRHDAHGRLRRRDARLLAALGDAVLDDVGLARADVQAVAGPVLSQRWWE